MTARRSLKSLRSILFATALAGLGSPAGCALSAYLGYQASPDYPRGGQQRIELPGLAAPVEVWLDPQGVPHVRARSERDLMLAVGFVQARERFFEMDMIRRIARGRVSELVGEQPLLGSSTVEFDRVMRGWGLEEGAQQDVQAMDAETRELIEAFAAGVHAAIAKKRPIEHRLLGLEPEPWTPADSFAVGRLTAWSVTHNWSQELSRLLLALELGPDRAEALYPSRPWPGGVSIQLEGEPRPLPPAVVPEVRPLLPAGPRERRAAPPGDQAAAAPLPSPGLFALGSNAWAVGGARTRSGKPLVASDPHLTHLLPSMMTQMHVQCPAYEAIGVSVPGLPYVLIGHNTQVAWGMTSAVADVVDFYLEEPNPQNPDEVRVPGGFQALERREVTVRVRQGGELEARVFTQRHSRNGPLVQDLYPGKLPAWAPPTAMRWDSGPMADSLDRLRRSQRARSVEELRELLAGVAAPSSVYTAADVHGGVALFACGRIPVRPAHLGTFPVPGWLPAYQWQGFQPAEALPYTRQAEEATLAHANGLLWDPARAPFPFHVDSAPSYRFDRIQQLLQAHPRHDWSTFARIHRDVHVLRAEQVLPAMLADLAGMPERSEREDAALGLLLSWDREAGVDSVATSLFFELYRQAGLLALADEVPESTREFVLAQRYSTHMMDSWYDQADHPVWDDLRTPGQERRPEVVRAAFRLALEELGRQLGRNVGTWHWGRLHAVEPRHVMGGKAALADLVNLPRRPLPGALDTVWKAHFDIGDPRAPYKVIAGPVYRMIADLSDLQQSWWISDTGASGWPGSPHYGDQHALWARGEYVPMLSDWKVLEQRARGRLELVPTP
jgi:penicillin amidase